MTTLATRTAPSLYSGMILTLIALALALEASFLAGLVAPRGSLGRSLLAPAVTGLASPPASGPALPAPCVGG